MTENILKHTFSVTDTFPLILVITVVTEHFSPVHIKVIHGGHVDPYPSNVIASCPYLKAHDFHTALPGCPCGVLHRPPEACY